MHGLAGLPVRTDGGKNCGVIRRPNRPPVLQTTSRSGARARPKGSGIHGPPGQMCARGPPLSRLADALIPPGHRRDGIGEVWTRAAPPTAGSVPREPSHRPCAGVKSGLGPRIRARTSGLWLQWGLPCRPRPQLPWLEVSPTRAPTTALGVTGGGGLHDAMAAPHRPSVLSRKP